MGCVLYLNTSTQDKDQEYAATVSIGGLCADLLDIKDAPVSYDSNKGLFYA